jgi:hypothetical protein
MGSFFAKNAAFEPNRIEGSNLDRLGGGEHQIRTHDTLTVLCVLRTVASVHSKIWDLRAARATAQLESAGKWYLGVTDVNLHRERGVSKWPKGRRRSL